MRLRWEIEPAWITVPASAFAAADEAAGVGTAIGAVVSRLRDDATDRPDAFMGMDARVLRLAAGIVAGALARQRSVERHEALAREYAAVSARMTSAMAASPTAMMIHDLDGIIEVWNPAA